ncbi:MAG: glycoside hydrolase family 99-like domain-containing protein [Verrucomicrobia bacterium]|nr:glycoside hydrolase family 99-like domain-containing protein [Verrucomicrobiota bacterium]
MAQLPCRPEVAVIYCPLWHPYDHAAAWKGEGWCEWELLKSAIPRFRGHRLPLRPTWGCFDESDPKWAAREIDLAADHGVDVFIFDWYWYSGVRLMEEALERGFLRAPNRRRLKFALMWANHHWADYFPAPFDQPWNSWLPIRHTPRDLTRVVDYAVENYFRQPNYWRVEDRLFFSLFQAEWLVEQLGGIEATRREFRKIDRRLAAAGLPAMHWNAMTWGAGPVAKLKAAGFHSTTTYNVTSDGRPKGGMVQQYPAVMAEHGRKWRELAAAPLPHCPVVTMGWDVTMRCVQKLRWPFPPSKRTGNHDYPYCHLVVGNTPRRFGRLCCQARAFAESDPRRPYAVFVNAWNEWTEASYLLPEKRYGLAYLRELKKAFLG